MTNTSNVLNIEDIGVNNPINLADTPVIEQYNGAGSAFLIVEDGIPTKLIYENQEYPSVRKDLSDDELYDLFESKGVILSELAESGGLIIVGHCSCTQFCFPEIIFGK